MFFCYFVIAVVVVVIVVVVFDVVVVRATVSISHTLLVSSSAQVETKNISYSCCYCCFCPRDCFLIKHTPIVEVIVVVIRLFVFVDCCIPFVLLLFLLVLLARPSFDTVVLSAARCCFVVVDYD